MKNHYERIICLCCFLIFFTNIGLPSTSFNVFQPYIAAQVGNTNASMILASRTLVSLICMLFVARFVGFFGARKAATIAAGCTALGFFLYSFATSLPGFFLGAVFAGAGYGLGGMVIVTLVTRRWFATGVATALGIATMGSGVSSVLLSPIVARVIEAAGLSWGFRLEAIVAVVLGAIIFLFLRDSPKQMGMEPYSAPAKNGKKPKSNHEAAKEPLSKPAMALLLAGIICMSCCSVDAYNYFSILLTSQGVDTMHAATLVAVLGGALTGAKLVSGVVLDRVGTIAGTALLYACMILGLICCIFSGTGGLIIPTAAALLFGAGATLGSVGVSLWSMEFATPETMTKTVKNMQVAYSFGGFAFSIIPGPLADLTGTYVSAYMVLLCLSIISAIIVLGTYLRKTRR